MEQITKGSPIAAEAVKPDRSLYLGQIYHRKKQWLYQDIPSIDYVGQDTGATPFDQSKVLG